MDFLELMQRRYTTKKYQVDARVADTKIAQIEEILRLSPSSINSQPWLFTIVSNPEVKARLASHSGYNEPKVQNCSHVVVFSVYADVPTFEAEALPRLAEGSRKYYEARIKPLGDAAVQAWLARQVYISLGVLLSACAVLGIDSTPMEGIDTEAYTRELGQRDHKVLFAAALGLRACEDENQPGITPKIRRDKSEVVVKVK